MFANLFPKPPSKPRTVAMLRDALNPNKRHCLTALYPGDQLHVIHRLLEYGRGAVLPVYGFAAEYTAEGHLYKMRAYVRPLSTTQPQVVRYENREFVRRPAKYQREQWFGAHLLFVQELDLTDHGDCLRLARLDERLADLLPLAAPHYRQAA